MACRWLVPKAGENQDGLGSFLVGNSAIFFVGELGYWDAETRTGSAAEKYLHAGGVPCG
jgi:hypothetical protein